MSAGVMGDSSQDGSSLPGLPQLSATNCGARTTETYSPQFWKLEVQNQGVGRPVLPQKPVTQNPSPSLGAAGVCQQSLETLGF